MAKHTPKKRPAGVTMVEIVTAAAVLAVACVGTIGFQHHARRLALRANAEITAARTARLILDNWKKTGGDENFDLRTLEMGFTKSPDSNDYRITVDGLPMTVSLKWSNVEQNAAAMVTLRQIEATIRWRSDRQNGTLGSNDPMYVISTYVRRDEAGG